MDKQRKEPHPTCEDILLRGAQYEKKKLRMCMYLVERCFINKNVPFKSRFKHKYADNLIY